jgi:GTP-binding protein
VLFETIIKHTPPPSYDPKEPFQMLVADLGYSAYMGRLAIGRVVNGNVNFNDSLVCIGEDEAERPLKVTKIQVYEGVTLKEVNQAGPGDIVVLSGIDDVKIGDTICNREFPKALKRITVEEPTVSMRFTINTSPLAGKEGKYVQSSKIKERLFKETLRNVAIKVDESEERDSFTVKGRGEFQLAILIETMRREGYEFCVGRPEVILKEKDGRKQEPIEHLYIDADEAFMGILTEKLSQRKGKMINLVNSGTGRVRMEFTVPSRGLIGFRDDFLTVTRGTGIMNSYLEGFDDYRGDFPSRFSGSIVADRQGESVAYALFNLEPRGGSLLCLVNRFMKA